MFYQLLGSESTTVSFVVRVVERKHIAKLSIREQIRIWGSNDLIIVEVKYWLFNSHVAFNVSFLISGPKECSDHRRFSVITYGS